LLAPTPDAQAQNRQVVVPILMYHYVEPWPADADEIRKNLTVRPEDFAAQMGYLHDQGYVTVSLYDLVYALTLGRPLPEKAVIVTFDDGYRTLPQYAAPVMERYGYRGTVFVITEFMDNGYPAYLTWPEAERLYAQGWKIEPHSKSHEELAGRDRAFQLYQMLGSIQTVAAHIGVQPRFFCYPSGKYDDLTVQLAHELNLWGGVTVAFGRTHTLKSLYTLGRVRVGGQETLLQFQAGLTP
jgi:peptidoglycan/xylan/chitin deacetylase (PgdA/CDA1 family)